MSRRLSALLLVLLTLPSVADVFRPAYLELTELGGDRYAVLWKVPMIAPQVGAAIAVSFPPQTRTLSPVRASYAGDARVERWQIELAGGLANRQVAIEGTAAGASDVIVRVQRQDGSAQVERLPISSPTFTVRPATGSAEVAWTYLLLGIEHILGGVDHLLFVLALLLVVHGGRRIVVTITAFTVAHSVTLAAATLGWVHVAGPPVEAIIALSIVFVSAEVIHGRRGRPGLTARAPWVVAFSFGLLHGLGFAGALAEVGLPERAIPVALLTFNVGVEIGQLMFVVSVLVLRGLLRRLPRAGRLLTPDTATPALAYVIGAVAAFWTIERIASFWS